MRDIDLIQLALALVPPWMVADANFDADKKRLDVDDLPGVDVDEQRNVVLAALSRGLVDGDAPQVGECSPTAC
jgi:hypothetical protein